MASWIRPRSTSRILLAVGTVRLLRKLRATISHSDENSNGVKSDFLGIDGMALPPWRKDLSLAANSRRTSMLT